LQKRRKERKAWGHMEWMPHIGDKLANARALQGMAELGLVGIANTEHGDWLLDQLLAFPAGKHDDGVDEAALIARAIDEVPAAMAAAKQPNKQRDRWHDAFDDDEADSWKVA